ncbi:MAG: hypothetical protein PUF65_03055 [Lachnospiraceae bacterium]|nr:hypothetical protein [Lachnospiraceae bacterium]
MQEYKEYSLQEKITILGLQTSDTMTSVFEKMQQYFEGNGFDESFDELYEEEKQLTEAIQKDVTEDREEVMRELESYGPYLYLKNSVKADAFKFDVSDVNGNLKLFINVLDKLGVFFASPFWTKLQNIFGHCCMSKLDKVAKRRPALIRPA